MTDSMQRAIDETDRRRAKQELQPGKRHHAHVIISPLTHGAEMTLAGILNADYADLTDEAAGIPTSTPGRTGH